MKRKLADAAYKETRKRRRQSSSLDPNVPTACSTTAHEPQMQDKVMEAHIITPPDASQPGPNVLQKKKRRKLAPPRPFPTVATSASATGPRSSHIDGKNYICVTRKTPLASYIRRCKDLVLKDGIKIIHLSAMGAAIPTLLLITCAVRTVLSNDPEEIYMDITTATTEVHDEIIPDDEDEDITYETRGKSTLKVVIRIGKNNIQMQDNSTRPIKANTNKGDGRSSHFKRSTNGAHGQGVGDSRSRHDPFDDIVLQEPDQELDDML